MIVALVALVVAMGGTGYAALQLPKNSVGKKQLKKRAVTRSKIATNAVTSPKVKNGSLLSADFATGQLPAGPKGDTGAAGAAGDTGAAGTARAYAAFAANGDINPTDSVSGDPIGGSAQGLSQSDETAHTVTGTYCFHPSFTPKSAMVSAIGDLNAASSSFIAATVSVRTNNGLSSCDTNDTVRVRMFVVANPPVLADEPFTLWLE